MASTKLLHARWICVSGMRVLALVLAFFSLCNEVYHHMGRGVDPQIWWVDFGRTPEWVRLLAMGIGTIYLFWFAIAPPQKKSVLIGFLCSMGLLVGMAGFNTVSYWTLRETHLLYKAPILPFSLCVLLFLVGLMATAVSWYRHSHAMAVPQHRSSRVLAYTFAICIAFVAVPCAQIFTFGRTDYRRAADVAVVFGAHTYKNGQPSPRLASRVRRACELYKAGQVRMLIMSGGPGDGAIHETEAMETLAIQLGVRKEDILTDRDGFNTHQTVENTVPLFKERGWKTILAVSDFSHTPRIKLAYGLAGQQVYTVPAERVSSLTVTLFQLLRETAALWVYYTRGLVDETR